jgi:DNA-binding transcriptional regulator LsrR (DeoR family)
MRTSNDLRESDGRRRRRTPADGPVHLVRLAQVVERYYRGGETKSAIAHDLGMSRFKVARSIDEALSRGLVRIEISMPESPIDLELSEALRQRYGLRHAIVLAARGLPPDFNRQELGAVAGSVLAETVDEDSIVGIAWGRTLDKMATALPPLPGCTVVQVNGGVSGVGISVNSHDVVRRVAARAGGDVYAFYAPLIAPDAATAQSLKRDPAVARSVEQFDRLTCAVVTIGSWEPMESMMAQSFEPELVSLLLRLGVVADISGSLIDRNGRSIRTPFDDRRVTISGTQLRAVPEVIAVAGGIEKVEAIHAALLGGWVSTLVTDADVAEALSS